MKHRTGSGDIGDTAVLGSCLRKRVAHDVGECLQRLAVSGQGRNGTGGIGKNTSCAARI